MTCQLCAEGIARHRILSEELDADTQFRELDLILTISITELAREYLRNLQLALEVGRELHLRLYPLSTYPLHVMPGFATICGTTSKFVQLATIAFCMQADVLARTST